MPVPPFPHTLSVIFHIPREAGSQSAILLTTLMPALSRYVADFEVLIVVHAAVPPELERASNAARFRVKAVTVPPNAGFGADLRAGISAASKDYVLYFDASGTYAPQTALAVLEGWEPGTDFVCSYTDDNGSLFAAAGKRVARFVTQTRLRGIDSGIWLVRGSLAGLARPSSDTVVARIEFLKQAEMMAQGVKEVPVTRWARFVSGPALPSQPLRALREYLWVIDELVIARALFGPPSSAPVPKRKGAGR